MSDTPTHLEPRVARLEGGMEQVVSTLEKVVKSVDAVSEKVDRKTSPNRGDQIATIAVFLTFLGMVAWMGVRESDALDTRLQREMRQVNDTTLERINSLDTRSAQRHEEVMLLAERSHEDVNTLRAHEWDLVKADLDELRARRMKQP